MRHEDIANNDGNSYNGFAIDIGDFSLDQPSRSRILGDDTASVATLGIPTGPDDTVSDEGDDVSDHANQDDQAMDMDEDANIAEKSSLPFEEWARNQSKTSAISTSHWNRERGSGIR
jgi:hypothetical protein